MSDTPERINAWVVRVQPLGNDEQAGLWRSVMKPTNSTEYRRADLPPTDEECLRNEKVRALVEALEAAQESIATFMGVHGYPNDSGAGEVLQQVCAALAALPKVKE
jgi:hypothetical protein